VVECDLAKVEVAGSNPVSRSSSHLSSVVVRRTYRPLGVKKHFFLERSANALESPRRAAEIKKLA
jgi:hypothetical protein